MKFCIKYLSHILFAVALAYYGILAFAIETNPMFNKMMMVIIGGFWILWIFAKSVIKVLAAIALLLAMCFAGYYIMHADEIECKKAGKEWNAKLQICEEKKTAAEKIKNAVTSAFKETMKKLKETKNKSDEKGLNETKQDETQKTKAQDTPKEAEKTDDTPAKTENKVSVKDVLKDVIKESIRDTLVATEEFVKEKPEEQEAQEAEDKSK